MTGDEKRSGWRATVLTLFPDMFPGPLGASLAGKSLHEGVWSLDVVNIRDFATDRHGRVDDQPFGGGPGMVLRPDIVDAAVAAASGAASGASSWASSAADSGSPTGTETVDRGPPILYLSPRGRPLTQARVRALADGQGAVLLCGRYEGVDARVIDAWDMEEVSLGDYVLSGGEIAAMALIDAVVRVLPGVIGSAESLTEESFEAGLLEYPHFTRPEVWTDRMGREHVVPEILKSGHHGKIAEWRRREAEETTKTRRPDMWSRHQQAQPAPNGELGSRDKDRRR